MENYVVVRDKTVKQAKNSIKNVQCFNIFADKLI